MTTAEILSLISVISYIVAGICLVLAIFFWFFFKIPSVIGDLSGRTAKKSIARRRASNERAGGKGYQPSATNANRGKLTDTMQHSRKLKAESKKAEPKKAQPPVDESQMPETGLLMANKAQEFDSQQTELLDCEETTTLVDENATVPLVDENATALLQETPATPMRPGGKKLQMLDEVMLIHTDEVI